MIFDYWSDCEELIGDLIVGSLFLTVAYFTGIIVEYIVHRRSPGSRITFHIDSMAEMQSIEGVTVNKQPSQRVEQDDTVIHVGRGGKLRIGLVTEVPEDHSDEDESKDMTNESLKLDEISVDWYPKGHNAVMREEQVFIIDRGLQLGEAVKSCKDTVGGVSSSRIGFVADICVTADLTLLPDRKLVITDADLRRAQFLAPYAVADHSNVLFGSWIGSVTKCVNQLHIVRGGKFRCIIRDELSPEDLRVKLNIEAGSFFDSAQWYTGEQVLVSVGTLQSAQTHWLTQQPVPVKRSKSLAAQHRMLAFTVEKAEMCAMHVRWYMTHSTETPTPPAKILTGTDLQRVLRLDVQQHQSAKMGDRLQLARGPSSSIVSRSDWYRLLRAEMDPNFAASATANTAKSEMQSMDTTDSSVPRSSKSKVPDSHNLTATSSRSQLSATSRSMQTSQLSVASTVRSIPSSIRVSAASRLKRAKARLRKAAMQRRRFSSKNDRENIRKRKSDGADNYDAIVPIGQTFLGEIIRTKTHVTVLWMDGNMEYDVPTRNLYLSDLDLDHHEHIPGSLVVKKANMGRAAQEFGLVMTIDVDARIAEVKWFYLSAGNSLSGPFGIDLAVPPLVGNVERCSLFSVQLHPMYQGFGLGQLVMRITKTSDDMSSLVGQVLSTAIPNGTQLVHWFNGIEEQVWPMELTSVLGGDMDDDFASPNGTITGDGDEQDMELGSQNDNDSSWESASSDSNDDDGVGPARGMSLSVNLIPDALMTAIETCSQEDHDVLQYIINRIVPSGSGGHLAEEATTSSASAAESATEHQPEELMDDTQSDMDDNVTQIPDNEQPTPFDGRQQGQSLTVLSHCYADHYYRNGRSSEASPNAASRVFLRAVREEMKLLSSALPPGIHVAAFEDRLPAQYPNEPPLVFYKSYSQEQLNPNLYLTGKVCVSLLGTWAGKGSEQWNVGSNLVQVFISIQGLILNAEPYFNEAGYESRRALPEAVEKSRRYNEIALVNALDYFIQVTRNPPLPFAQWIRDHFKANNQRIRKRLNAWLSGSESPGFPLAPISEGCAFMLRQQLVQLDGVSF